MEELYMAAFRVNLMLSAKKKSKSPFDVLDEDFITIITETDLKFSLAGEMMERD